MGTELQKLEKLQSSFRKLKKEIVKWIGKYELQTKECDKMKREFKNILTKYEFQSQILVELYEHKVNEIRQQR